MEKGICNRFLNRDYCDRSFLTGVSSQIRVPSHLLVGAIDIWLFRQSDFI